MNMTKDVKKSKKTFIIAVVVIGLLVAGGIASIFIFKKAKTINSAAKGYNLLVITLDTLRADRVGVYGYAPAKTPNLDFLAKNGVMYENCYTPVPLTLPAHSSIFTGKYPIAHRVRGNGMYMLPDSEVTLAEQMKEKGYDTFGVIASFVLLAKFGLDQGFDFYDDSLVSHKMYNNYMSEISALEVYWKFCQWFDKNYHKKFFGWVHLYDPHTPYKPPKKYAEQFSDDPSGRYDGEVAYADDCVGKIIEKLKKKEILDKTVVVILGDHGEAFGEHEEHGHGIFCYQEALKVPLIFYNPVLFPGAVRVKTRVNLIDLMPTLMELYGMNTPEGNQGKSFIQTLQGNELPGGRDFYFESMHGKDEMNWAPLMGILHENYKYISLPEPELYDLKSDGIEKDNLFWKKNRTAKELDKKLMKMAAAYSKAAGETDARRELTAEDKKHLSTLGYISSFSDKTGTGTITDPKKGIILDNRIKAVFKIIGEENYLLAEEELNKLIAEYPGIQMPVFFDLKHQLYSRQNNIAKTLETLKEALEKHPKIERFYILYAFKVFDTGNIEEAEKTCRKLLELNPRFTRAYILLGQIAERRGNLDNAFLNYGKALEVEPQNISLKLKYAGLLIMKQEHKKALAIYDELLERQEVFLNAELLFKIALFNVRYGTLEKSETLLKKAIDLDPNGKYYFNYALVLNKNQKIKEALENMEIALDKYKFQLNKEHIDIAQKAVALWRRQGAAGSGM